MNTIINVTSGLFFLSELILFIIKRSKSNEVKIRKDQSSSLILWIVITICVCFGIYFSTLYPRREVLIVFQWSGVFILFIGFVIRWTSIYQLKKAFTVDVSISLDHKMKQDGLYKKIRHPSYLGFLLEWLGFSLLFNSWLPLFIINIPVFFAVAYRMKIEEELLTDTFGKDYEEYKNQTKRILPGIY